MKDTIRAEYGYTVTYNVNKQGEQLAKVKDGINTLLIAKVRTQEDYVYEKADNEMFIFNEIFTTIKGNQFIYWGDKETGDEYLTKVNK